MTEPCCSELRAKLRWRIAAFDVTGRASEPRLHYGWVRGRFGVFDKAATLPDRSTRVVSSVVVLATGAVLAAFQTRREAQMAAAILDDQPGLSVPDLKRAAAAWRLAGYITSGSTDDAGNTVWRRQFYLFSERPVRPRRPPQTAIHPLEPNGRASDARHQENTMTNKEAVSKPARGSHPLAYPIERADGSQINELVLRRARAKDILAIERVAKQGGSDAAATLAFLASINNLSDDEIGELDAEDYAAVSERVIDFLPDAWKAARAA